MNEIVYILLFTLSLACILHSQYFSTQTSCIASAQELQVARGWSPHLLNLHTRTEGHALRLVSGLPSHTSSIQRHFLIPALFSSLMMGSFSLRGRQADRQTHMPARMHPECLLGCFAFYCPHSL